MGSNYSVAGPNTETERAISDKTAIRMHNEVSNVFKGIGCFKGAFLFKVKEDSEPYNALPRHVANALQEAFKKELERLQQ